LLWGSVIRSDSVIIKISLYVEFFSGNFINCSSLTAFLMEHFSFESFKDWFGYTRRERRSSFILLLLIAAVGGIRFIIPNLKMNMEVIPLESSIVKDSSIMLIHQEPEPYVYRNPRKPVITDLNKCDSAALVALPGIGPVLSARIIKYRKLLGGFADVSQLKEVYGLPEETYNNIVSVLKADPADIKKISVNEAGFSHLIRLPYFEKYEVNSILRYRELQGKIRSCDELVENKILTREKADRVKWYLDFSE